MKKVVIIEGKRPTLMPEGPSIERDILGQDVNIECYGVIKTGDLKAILEDADAVIARPGTQFSANMISLLRKARVIVSLGVGYDHISVAEAIKKNIPVCNVPDYGTEEVADSAVAMLLAHHRKIFLFSRRMDDRPMEWDWRIHMPILRTRDLRVGIIGLGRIGTAVAIRLKAFGYKISFYDPYQPRGLEKAVGLDRFYRMEDIISSSDIITVHVPLNRETSGMVDEDFFRLMKPNAILLNTARGGIFRNADILHKFLKERPELRIGSDVWPDEPPADHPLLEAWRKREPWLGDRLILCPHSAFYSDKSIRDIRAFAAEIVKTVLSGGKPYNIVKGDDL